MCSREAGVGAPFTGNETTSTGGDVDASGIAKAATVNKCGPSDVVVRLAKLGDAANLTKIINTAIGASRVDRVNEFGVDRVTADGKQVTRLIQKHSSAFLVAEEPDADHNPRIVGCCHVSWSRVADKNYLKPNAFIGMLAVPEEFGRRGIATLLMASAEQYFRQKLEHEDITVEISVFLHREDLCTWYERLGYKKGSTVPYPRPEIIREGLDATLQLMTKKIP